MALAIAFALLSALGFACGNVFIRMGIERVTPRAATFWTVLTGAVLLISLAFAFNFPEIKSLKLSTIGWFALMGLMAYPLARVLQNTAINMVGASRAVPMASVQPLVAFMLGMLLLGERPNLLVSAGTPVIVAGLLMVVLAGNIGSAERVISTRNFGYLLAIGAATAFASRDIISRHIVTGTAPALVTAAFALAIGAIMLMALVHRDVAQSIRRVPGGYLALCGIAGIFQGLAVTALFQALSRAPVTVVSPIYASQPMITLFLVHIFLKRLETISPLLVLGTFISIGGVALVIVGAATS